jgi:RNA polymerase sigma-70 factor (ECF subfamily)
MANGQLGNVLRHIRRLMGAPAAGDQTDRQLLERFVHQGEEAAFTALVQRHGPLVWGVCRRLLSQTHDAEDAFQATFFVLARKAASVAWQESMANWLYGVALRIATKARGQTARRQARERQVLDMTTADSKQQQSWHDLRPLLDEEVNRLPAKYRAPVVLCYLQGKTNEQAAQELGCPKGTILSRLARARERLRDRLARRGVALPAALLIALLSQNAAPAAVPAALIDSTPKAALLFAAGQAAAAGTVSAQAAIFAEGVLKSMFVTKVTIAATVLLALSVLGTGTGVFIHQALADKPVTEGLVATEAQNNAGGVAPGGVAPGQANNNAGAEVRGKLKKVDAAKGVITLEVAPILPPGGDPNTPAKDIPFTVAKDTKIVDQGDNAVVGGLKHKFFEKPGGMVTITLQKKQNTNVVTKVKIDVEPVR